MIPLWKILTGNEKTDLSRLWDLTERVPIYERQWFRAWSAIVGLVIFVILLAVWIT